MDKYEKAADAPSYSSLDGVEYNVVLEAPIDFIDMKGVPLDDPKWDEFLSQMSLSDLCISIGDARGIAGVSTINKPMNAIAEGPKACWRSSSSATSAPAPAGRPCLPSRRPGIMKCRAATAT